MYRIEADPEHTSIRMSEWATAQGEGVLEADGIGPCVGLAIYDYDTHTGYLGHFEDAYREDSPSALDEMIEAAKGRGHDPASLQAWMGGGHLDPDDPEGSRERRDADQAVCLAKLGELGIYEVEIGWVNPDEALSITLNCATGECQLVPEPGPEPYEE
jgi:hypothetical protein